HSAAADLSPSLVSTAAEAHPARSPCAFAEAVGQWHLIRLSHITGKKIAHGVRRTRGRFGCANGDPRPRCRC
ncbi:MAG: hypothetical protein IJI41_05830, partial [Anaerolineaceae bacterium]|nr:hypothetical protein [Anaerolineaceae bacterium]